MFFRGKKQAKTQVTLRRALGHLIVFQVKLAADALRDFIMSPLSIAVFVLDALRRPALEDSLYVRLMLFGRRTDRYINLFDEYRDKGHYTMDEAIETVGKMADELSRDVSRPPGDED